ncbi:TPA: hypothetical protein DCL28_00465 [Candidatus Komeilibacteria bacterium]|nr:MAG: Tfp pilus assembly protein ATPase PilM-like protein [Parcubacteria group bacterium GW2011_GWF2_45_11]KKT98307.1 MAG: Tfp pilus assembly protein ATPase PilM-like protein [Parcubacteria group bacterium GW2011_GWC2_45_15]OGY93985.1 MAG: hypothetical protein A3J95_02140 [Candidatus Komeilibacteria bacterium RIFOXYC2_FULL_45_12]OGY94386.1 MAG: hypothetical protein A2260_00600 [Candidatus Komeilibacteria bacterium RIFOXYA2_FULL_45_9]HAH04018.1 hypothetical protein [Candidatus Komeilibacteria 
MGIFSSAKVSYVGVDVGTASIKLVELKRESGRPFLVTYGYVDISTDIIRSNTPETRKKIVDSLKKVIASAGVTTASAIAALPTFSVFNSIITLPKMQAKDLASAVRWEAKKYVPLPLEEMILDWKIIKEPGEKVCAVETSKKLTLEQQSKKGGFSLFSKKKAVKDQSGDQAEAKAKPPKKAAMEDKSAVIMPETRPNKPDISRILVTAAPKNLVNRYIQIFNQAGLKLISLETEAFALSRALIGADKATIMIVDIGSITTDMCVIEQGVPILNRSIDVGGLTITQSIAKSLDISLERAEQFKRDFGVSINQESNQKGIPKVITTALAPIVNEIKYVFDLYQNQGNLEVEKIILAGGSAFLPNLADYFANLFNKPAVIGNPWDRVVYPEELKPVLDEVGSRLAVAIGLAMRDL